MKLLIATDRDFWKADIGSRKRISQLCSYLGQANLEVHLYLTFGGTTYSSDEINAIRKRFGFKSIRLYAPKTPGNIITHLKNRLNLQIKKMFRTMTDSGAQEKPLSAFRDEQIKIQFDQCVEEVAPDFILLEYLRLAYLTDPTLRGIKTIIDTHDVMHLRYEAFKKAGKPHWLKISKEEEIEALNKFDAVLAIQEREQEYFRQILDENTSVLHVGMDTVTNFLPEPEATCLSIGFIGAHGDPNIEGITTFIDKVWPKLVKSTENTIKLIIAGSICSILAQRVLAPGIELLGIVDDIRDFYRQSTIIINPVTFGGGLKIKTVEALAFGKPLVSTPVGAVGLEDGAGSAFLVAENEEEFLHHLRQLIDSADQRQALAKRALTYAETQFSAENIYRELSSFLGL